MNSIVGLVLTSDNAHFGKVEASNELLYYYDKYEVQTIWEENTEWVFKWTNEDVSCRCYDDRKEWDATGYASYDFDKFNNKYTVSNEIELGLWGGLTVYKVKGDKLYKYITTGHRWYEREEGSYRVAGYMVVGDMYERDTTKNVQTKEKGKLLTANLKAIDKTYPNDGIHSDGFWYVKKGIVNNLPTVSLSTSNNQLLLGVLRLFLY